MGAGDSRGARGRREAMRPRISGGRCCGRARGADRDHSRAAARAEAGLLFACWAVIFVRPGLGFVDVDEAWCWARAVARRLGARARTCP